MRFCFILASITGREKLLNAFIEAAKSSKYKDCDFYLYFQNTTGEEPGFDAGFFRGIIWSSERDGCCLPRMRLLEAYPDYDFWIIVDDDVEFCGGEDYEAIMRFLNKNPTAGICIGDYGNNRKNYESRLKKAKRVFEVKNIAFVEGGQVISRKIRKLLLEQVPMDKLTYDAYNITAYVNGYTNYKYYGSVCLHKLTNGTQGYVYVQRHSAEFKQFYEQWIAPCTINAKGQQMLPEDESWLTEEARKLHEENERRLNNGGNTKT